MPQKTVFIRDEDLLKWNLTEKKSQWLHDALNSEKGITRSIKQSVEKAKEELVEDNLKTLGIIKTPEQAKKIVDGHLTKAVDNIGKEFIGPISKSYSARKNGEKK